MPDVKPPLHGGAHVAPKVAHAGAKAPAHPGGIKGILTASTAGMPNWVWLLAAGAGIALAIFVPKLFPKTSGSADQTATDAGTPAGNPADGGGAGGGSNPGDNPGGSPPGGSPPPPQPPVPGPNPIPPVPLPSPLPPGQYPPGAQPPVWLPPIAPIPPAPVGQGNPIVGGGTGIVPAPEPPVRPGEGGSPPPGWFEAGPGNRLRPGGNSANASTWSGGVGAVRGRQA